MNKILEFNDLYRNVVDNIDSSKELISSSLEFIYYENSGIFNVGQTSNDPVLVPIYNNGITPVTDVKGLDMYIQSLSLQCLFKQFDNVPEKQQLQEVENVINTFINNYKTHTTKINDITVLYNISEAYRLEHVEGNKMRLTLPFTITIIENATITNDVCLYIDDEELFYTNIEFNRNGENSFNNIPGAEIKSFKNTTYTQLSIMGLWIKDGGILDKIMHDDIICNNVSTDQTYIVEMRIDGETVKTWKMYINSGKITGKTGSIAAYTLTFLEYSDV